MTSKNPALENDDKFERTVKRLLSTPPKPREEMKVGKPRGKKAMSPKRKSRKSKREPQP
jgi:hypothetical protein